MMERRLSDAQRQHNLTYLELLRNVSIRCEEFVIFVRDKSFGPDPSSWPPPCGHLLSSLPILSPFGTCFTTHPNFTQRTSSFGVTERITLVLSTFTTIQKRPSWLQDESLRSGVFFSLAL